MPQTTLLNRLTTFLREELGLPSEAIAMAERQESRFAHLMPMVLWQYGLVTLDQLNQILDWLETAQTFPQY